MPTTATLFGKRLFDIVVSSFALLLLAPFFLIISLLIALTSRGPVFFLQERVGKNGNPFKIMKFRTMVQDAEKLGKQITVGNDARITKIGKFLRATKLDELPQLCNIVVGTMSFVGPRPEVPRYVALYNDMQRQILKIKPGLTDLASIEYRHESERLAASDDPEYTYIHEIMPHKIELNQKYIATMSFFHDIIILCKTVWAVLH